MKTVKLYTARVGQDAENLIDITVKSGSLGAVLAPTWELVGGHKRYRDPENPRWQEWEPLSDEQYTERYLDLLRQRWSTHQPELNALFNFMRDKKSVAIACYCKPGVFCHRHVVIDPLIKMGQQYGVKLDYLGEYKATAVAHDEAAELANELLEIMRPVCLRIEVAGSVRRQKAFSGDLELVLIPDGQKWHTLTDQLYEQGILKAGFEKTPDGGNFKIAWGPKQRKAIYTGQNGTEVKVDMYVANPVNWGYILWLRTGPADQNKHLMFWLAEQEAPIQFRDSFGWWGIRKLNLAEETDLFAVLGIDFIPPPQRSHQALLDALNDPDRTWPDFSQWEVDPIQQFRPVTAEDMRYVMMSHEQRTETAAFERRPAVWHEDPEKSIFGIPGWVYDDWSEWYYHWCILSYCVRFTIYPEPRSLEQLARATYTSRLCALRESGPQSDKDRILITALTFLLSQLT